MSNTDRNAMICTLFSQGHLRAELAIQFRLTKVRIWQILHDGGLVKVKKEPKRTSFTGIHLSIAVKDALRKEAKREKQSMSAFIAWCIREELARRQVEIIEEPIYKGELLPL